MRSDRRGLFGVNIVELSPGMCPATGLDDAPTGVEFVVAGEGIAPWARRTERMMLMPAEN